VLGLATMHPGQAPQEFTPQLRAKVCGAHAAGASGWVHPLVLAQDGGCDKGERELDCEDLEGSRSKAASVRALHGVQRSEVSRESRGHPRIVFRASAKRSGVSACTRKARCQLWTGWIARLPLSPGRAEKDGFEYYRHGTLSLYAALNPKTGEVIGQTARAIPVRSSSPSQRTSSPHNRLSGRSISF
jgi:hypothetical protein